MITVIYIIVGLWFLINLIAFIVTLYRWSCDLLDMFLDWTEQEETVFYKLNENDNN